jgi:predicted ATPase
MESRFRPLDGIELQGYKSFRHLPRFQLNKGLNVLIGPNGAGKTNFIRFFELLRAMLDPNKGLQNYIAERGRADAFLFRGAKVTSRLRAHLWFDRNEYLFSLKASTDRSLFFEEEAAPFQGPLYGNVVNDQGSGHLESRIAKEPSTAAERWVLATVSDWRVYHFHDTSRQSRIMGLCNIVDNDQLWSDAGNLAAFLKRLKETQENYYQRILKTIKLVAPFFGDFELKNLGGGQTQLLWKERYSDLVLYPNQLSDGTIRFICLATLLLQPNPPSTIIIDEPELGLHPFAIVLIAGMLRERAADRQLILSTQSVPLIDEQRPEDLIVVDHVDGESALSRPDPAALANWLNDYSLGDLWRKNVLGGRPRG